MSIRRRHLPYIISVIAFFVYFGWLIGPYLYSTIVRDASITAWSRLASAPIFGIVEYADVIVNTEVPKDGIIAWVSNPQASQEVVETAKIKIVLAEGNVSDQHHFLEEIKTLDNERRDIKGAYSKIFKRQLDVDIKYLKQKIRIGKARLEKIRAIEKRSSEMLARGVGSASAADESKIRVSDLELLLAEQESRLAETRVRREGIDNGVYLSEDGTDAVWGNDSRMELKIAKKTARLELRRAEGQLRFANQELLAAKADYNLRRSAAIRVKPNSLFWRELISTGTTVQAGQTVAEWIDCSDLLIDVPVSDAEVSLIFPGDEATVVLEGENHARTASVLLTRGSASTLDRADLAALAKGRVSGVAQVILQLPSKPGEFPECPVGQAAFVDFPGVGLIDILRARLRL